MSVALGENWTLERFLAWEERQDARHEFDGTRPVAMAGGTAAHAAIQRNLITALTSRLRGGPCEPYGSDLKVLVNGRVRYPDAFVVCTPMSAAATVVTEPVAVFEVLSEAIAHDDLIVKNADYRATPSIVRYIILQQARSGAIVFARRGEDWVSDIISGHDTVLRLPECGIDLPLAEIYAGLDAMTEDAATLA